MRLSVYADGRCVVTVPRGVSERAVEEFVASRAEWIARSVERLKDVVPATKSLAGTRRHYLKHKEEARAFIASRIAVLNASGTFSFGDVRIKNQKSCWGSCSVKGNLNFNYRILFLPPAVADYVIAHELCHLKEFNHSPRFWKLVGELVPEHQRLRKELGGHEGVVAYQYFQLQERGEVVSERDEDGEEQEERPEDEEEQEQRTVQLFYYNPERDEDEEGNIQCSSEGLVAVQRTIPRSDTPIQDTIEELLRGRVTPQEEAQGVETEYPLAGFALEGADLQEGLLTLAFTDPNNATSGGSCRVAILWAQIERTALQFPEVEEVRFTPEELFQP